MFACQECGRKFKTVAAAERASNHGCPGCGGSDIDLAPSARPKPPVARTLADEGHKPSGWAERPMGNG